MADDELCYEPDHYISYDLNLSSIFNPISGIILADQFLNIVPAADGISFTEGTWIAGENQVFKLLNPSTKWHNGDRVKPREPNTHYVSFDLTYVPNVDDDITDIPTLRNGNFKVFNQFGTFNLTIDFNALGVAQPDNNVSSTGLNDLTLLVPSSKKACGSGNCIQDFNTSCDDCFPEGDHYLCYPIVEQCNVDTQGRLEDQFQKNRLFDRLVPSRICNPVAKTINGNADSFHDEETNHLMCFTMGTKYLNPPRLVHLLNQFGEQTGFVEHDNEICVPSVKVAIPIGN